MIFIFLFTLLAVSASATANFEGDIKVFRHQLVKSYGESYANEMQEQGFVVDDMRRRRQLGADSGYLWPNGVVPYKFKDDDFTQQHIKTIVMNINKMNDKVNPFVIFRPYDDSIDNNYIIFKAADTGCWSYLGMIGGPQTVNLGGKFCRELSTVEHELMHAIGFWHEQSRYDRDEYVKVFYENIEKGFEGQFSKRFKLEDYGFKYDYRSIMHYGSKSFSKNGKDVLKSINPPGEELGNWDSMSDNDIGQTRALYGERTVKPTMMPTDKPSKTPRPTTMPSPRPTRSPVTPRPTRPPSFVFCRRQSTRRRCRRTRRHRNQCYWSKRREGCYRRRKPKN